MYIYIYIYVDIRMIGPTQITKYNKHDYNSNELDELRRKQNTYRKQPEPGEVT